MKKLSILAVVMLLTATFVSGCNLFGGSDTPTAATVVNNATLQFNAAANAVNPVAAAPAVNGAIAQPAGMVLQYFNMATGAEIVATEQAVVGTQVTVKGAFLGVKLYVKISAPDAADATKPDTNKKPEAVIFGTLPTTAAATITNLPEVNLQNMLATRVFLKEKGATLTKELTEQLKETAVVTAVNFDATAGTGDAIPNVIKVKAEVIVAQVKEDNFATVAGVVADDATQTVLDNNLIAIIDAIQADGTTATTTVDAVNTKVTVVEAETYTVSTVTPAVVDKKDIATTDIVIAGTNFGTDKTKFVVMLGTETATIKTVTTTAITVNIDATQAARIMGTAQTLTIKRTVTGQTATIDRTKAGAFTVTPPAIASIAVTPATVTLVKDSTQQFVATATYDDTTTAVVTATATWAATSGTMSATTKGLYTAPAAEATGISVTATVGTIVGTSTVTVISSPLVSLAVTGAANATKVGQALTLQMTANGTHEDTVVRTATDVTWASTDTTVATISATGLITGLTAGTTNITATKGTIVSPAVTITVEALDSILIATTTASIKMTETATFTAVGSYATLGNVDVAAIATFAVATATNGTGTAALNVVTPTNPGTANVTATIGTVTSNTVLVTIDADPGIANVTFVRTGATTATLAWTTSYDVTSGLAYYSGLGSLGTGVDPISMKTLQETATATKTHTLSLTDIDATATADVTDPSKAGWRIKVGYTINGTLYESDLKLLTETN